MTRLAFGAKCGSPGSPPDVGAAPFRVEAAALASAAMPMPVGVASEEMPRVMCRRCPGRPSLLLRDRLVEIQNQARDGRVGCQFQRIQVCPVEGESPSPRNFSRQSGRPIARLESVSVCQQQSASRPGSRAAPAPAGSDSRCARAGVAPPSFIIRSASLRAASRNVTSFIRSSACSGVLVRDFAHRAGLAVGRIEVNHERRRHGALPEGVQAAAIQSFALVADHNPCRPPVPATAPAADTASPMVRRSSPPAGPRQPAPDRESSPAADASAGRAPAADFRDPLQQLRSDLRRLPIGRAHHDGLLHAPSRSSR